MTNQGDDLCMLVQEIGLPAVRVELVSADVVGMNALFLGLVHAKPLLKTGFRSSNGYYPGCLRRTALPGRLPSRIKDRWKSRCNLGRWMDEAWTLTCGLAPSLIDRSSFKPSSVYSFL